MADLAVIVPTRGRPENIRKVLSAWDFTNAWEVADLFLVIDQDDPKIDGYWAIFEETRNPDTGDPLFSLVIRDVWQPMVAKLNAVATDLAQGGRYFALGFAGDDHLPQTIGWAHRYLTVLHEMKTGMVYGDDGYQGKKLATEWAVTADAVRVLGKMVPAPVDHLYCDNAMMDLYDGAGALRHLPEVRIEHFNPYAGGKGEMDAQYKRVNSRDQYRQDGRTYRQWKERDLSTQIALVQALRAGAPGRAERKEKVVVARGSGPQKVTPYRMRSGPTSRREQAAPPAPVIGRRLAPVEFNGVEGATPDEIGIALADLAAQVPADQEIVELGTYRGRTALLLAWGAAQGHGAHVTAIDPWELEGNVYSPPFTEESTRHTAETNVRSSRYADRITLVQEFSHDVAAVWSTTETRNAAGGRPVGLLFVDGDHTYEGARRDIESWAPHLAPGAVIAVDDYGHPDWPGVAEAVDALVSEGFLEPIQTYHDRLAVTRLKVEQDTTRPAAITGEGVSPSPAGDPPADEIDEMFDKYHVPEEEPVTVEDPFTVHAGEIANVAEGTQVLDLNLGQLRTLAKKRRIRTTPQMRRAELFMLLGVAPK